MAYGTPNSLEEVEPYYTDIRGGRKPSPENLNELLARYRRIGGRTPLLEITRAQAQALQRLLGDGFHVLVGMKHWHPYIAESVEEIARERPARIIALAMAPHYSQFSIDGYIQRVREAAARSKLEPEVTFVRSWNDNPLFLEAVAERMESVRQSLGVGWEELKVVFSAHSLPERILQANDPYPLELEETCTGVAGLLGLEPEGWTFAYQSAGRTGERWLGPDILDTLDRLASEGNKCVLITPIGFVADHLEILYDIDVECAERAHALGLEMRRTESLNTSPKFIAALKSVILEHLS